jgi:anti-sigma-K factor RskA
MSDQLPSVGRVDELLAGLTLGDLSPEEHAELQDLLAQADASIAAKQAQTADRTSAAAGALAAASVAPQGQLAPIDPALRARLLAHGLALCVPGQGTLAKLDGRPAELSITAPRPSSQASALRMWSGWFAAAAALAVAVVGWMRPPQMIAQPAAPNLWTIRQSLINENPDTVVLAFANTQDPASKDLSGDVVWNQRLQQGYLRFKGLANNDPRTNQYQLWIFDQGRPPEYPVDGGVFDAASGLARSETGDIIIPIDAKLLVRNPAAFAVTIEQAGGVVVTKRERVIGLAAKPASQPQAEPQPAPPPSTP